MHHAPCPSLSLSLSKLFSVSSVGKAWNPRTLVSKLCSKKRIRGCSVFETREFHMGREETPSTAKELERILQASGERFRFSFLTFARGREKRLFPWFIQRCYFSFRGRKSFLFFIFHSDVSLQRKRGREREKGREERGSEQNCRNGQAEAVRRWRGVKEDVRRAEGGARY